MKTNSPNIDDELIQRVKEGDSQAFRQLVYRHKDVSLSLACSILKEETLAEDVLQEAFIKVYKKLHTFRSKSSFTTWLYRIVVNTAYNQLKKQKTTISLQENDHEEYYTSVTDTDHMKESDQKKYINRALQKLKPDEALLLRLFYLCELSIKEIEDITAFKTSKIKVSLHRGREHLHFQLRQLLGNDIHHLL